MVGLERGAALGEAVVFFLYDVPNVLLLLLGIVTVVSLLRSYFPPERVRAALAGHGTRHRNGCGGEDRRLVRPRAGGKRGRRLAPRLSGLGAN